MNITRAPTPMAATLVAGLCRAAWLLLTLRTYHAVLYALFALVVARMTATPVRGIDYAAIMLASVAVFV
ncbi:MAG: hypothetical protein K0B00_05280 [Rhodobacteraceae bacterium]|nr:hypothetical protein [Paracoccaceae bacterium]